MTESKRLYRSRENRMVAGVCGGIAEYFGLDPTVVRVGFVLVSVLTVAFPGLLAYLIMMIIIPESPTA
jgi:phage shock protein C